MIKFFAIVPFLVVLLGCKHQSISASKVIVQPHGTLLLAIICTDGIIIAADSRGSFTEPLADGSEHVFAYIDSCQKDI